MHQVVIGALVTGRRVLLAHRSPSKRANPGVWDLPGGMVETGESELEALARELHEELGVRIERSSASCLGSVHAGPAEDPAHVSAWLVPEWRGVPVNAAPEEHLEVRWFDIDARLPLVHAPIRVALLEAARRGHRGAAGNDAHGRR